MRACLVKPLLLCILVTAGCSTILPDRNTSIIKEYFEGWANKGSVDTLELLVSENVAVRHPQTVVEGRTNYRNNMTAFRTAFPDLRFEVHDILEQGGRAHARWTFTGTHKGAFMGKPASGKQVRVTGMSLFRIENGKIQEIWVNMDRLALMQQLGIIEVP